MIANGQNEKAFYVLARYHANGDTSDPLVNFEYNEICQTIKSEAMAANESSWKEFFRTKGNRHRFIICILVGIMIQWAGNGIVRSASSTIPSWQEGARLLTLLSQLLSRANPEIGRHYGPRGRSWD